MPVPQHIFKAYDIRGLVVSELSPDLAYRVGYYFVDLLKIETGRADFKGKAVIVGRDMRDSSLLFQSQVIAGIRDRGVNVIDIGLVSTPLFNFACTELPESAGGIMVTASHNPAEYNGFKATLPTGTSVPGVQFLPCREIALTRSVQTGALSELEPLPLYQNKIFSFVSPAVIKPLRVVIDAGNGMAAATFPVWLKQLPVTVEFLYLEPDGTFPNHEANPLKTETLAALQAKVVAAKADFGFALDGDCDRIGLVDETGAVVEASFVSALLGLEVLRDHPGAPMIYGLTCSRIVPELWRSAGAAATEPSAPGHAKIKKLMKDIGAAFAGELSGHLYYRDIHDLESSDLSLLYVLRLLSREGRPLSELLQPLKKYAHSGEINFKVADTAATLNRLEQAFSGEAKSVNRLDGLTFDCSWGWFNVRASNTEPLLRLNAEAYDASDLEERLAAIRAIINY